MSGTATVLVVGVPRSGTSWVGRVLGSTPGSVYLGEPDNHEHSPFALRAKLGLPGFYYPHLAPAATAPLYEQLWREALTSPRAGNDGTVARLRRSLTGRLLKRVDDATMLRSFSRGKASTVRATLAAALSVPDRPPTHSGNLVVKSVSAQLALDWIVVRFPVSVLVVLRHPLNVLSSWKEMGWLRAGSDVLGELEPSAARQLEETFGVPRLVSPSPVQSAAQLIGLLTASLLDSLGRHPEWSAVSHEALCRRPHDRFRAAAYDMGLAWSEDVDRLLDDLDRPGERYETTRVAAELEGVWRRRLGRDELADASGVLDRFAIEWPSAEELV